MFKNLALIFVLPTILIFTLCSVFFTNFISFDNQSRLSNVDLTKSIEDIYFRSTVEEVTEVRFDIEGIEDKGYLVQMEGKTYPVVVAKEEFGAGNNVYDKMEIKVGDEIFLVKKSGGFLNDLLETGYINQFSFEPKFFESEQILLYKTSFTEYQIPLIAAYSFIFTAGYLSLSIAGYFLWKYLNFTKTAKSFKQWTL